MKTKINNKLIRSFVSCYDPIEIGIPDNESLSVKDWIEKYRNQVKEKQDIIWLICRNDFMSDRDLRSFAVWCAREALKLIKNPDERSMNALDVVERYANGQATKEELRAARISADAAVRAAADAARAADAAVRAAADAAVRAADAAARAAASVFYTADAAVRAAAGVFCAADAAARAAAARAAAADAAARAAAAAARAAQIDKLLTYF